MVQQQLSLYHSEIGSNNHRNGTDDELHESLKATFSVENFLSRLDLCQNAEETIINSEERRRVVKYLLHKLGYITINNDQVTVNKEIDIAVSPTWLHEDMADGLVNCINVITDEIQNCSDTGSQAVPIINEGNILSATGISKIQTRLITHRAKNKTTHSLTEEQMTILTKLESLKKYLDGKLLAGAADQSMLTYRNEYQQLHEQNESEHISYDTNSTIYINTANILPGAGIATIAIDKKELKKYIEYTLNLYNTTRDTKPKEYYKQGHDSFPEVPALFAGRFAMTEDGEYLLVCQTCIVPDESASLHSTQANRMDPTLAMGLDDQVQKDPNYKQMVMLVHSHPALGLEYSQQDYKSHQQMYNQNKANYHNGEHAPFVSMVFDPTRGLSIYGTTPTGKIIAPQTIIPKEQLQQRGIGNSGKPSKRVKIRLSKSRKSKPNEDKPNKHRIKISKRPK